MAGLSTPAVADGNQSGAVLPVLVGVHIASLGNSSFAKRLVAGVWRTVCVACSMRCAMPQERLSTAPIYIHPETQVEHNRRIHPPKLKSESPQSPLHLPSQMAIVSYSRQQVPDFEGVAAVAHRVAVLLTSGRHPRAGDAGGGGGGGGGASGWGGEPGATPIVGFSKLLHFIIDLGGQISAHDLPSEQLQSGARPVGGASASSTSSLPGLPRSSPSPSPPPLHGILNHSYALTRLPGLSATRMMMRAAASGDRSFLAASPIQQLCQEGSNRKAVWYSTGVELMAWLPCCYNC